MSLPEHFWNKVEKTDTCWNWTGSAADGYGRFGSATNAVYSVYGTSLAHRIAWDDANGRVPDGLELDHLCNNRACVRPSHLEPVTHDENLRRAVERRDTCRNGHRYTVENRVSMYGDQAGRERCLECRRKTNRESIRRQRARKTPVGQVVTWDVRVWAWGNGYECSRLGAIPKPVLAAYLAAHLRAGFVIQPAPESITTGRKRRAS